MWFGDSAMVLALHRAKKKIGGASALARALGLTPQAVHNWGGEAPVRRVLDIERLTGVMRHELRPDFYPPPIAPDLPEGAERHEPATRNDGAG
jgi:DNA-binding transcriptional regulator YdaS (Cro superfamily)